MNISDAQENVDAWINSHGGYFSELTNMTLLTEEVGELARVMARKYGGQSYKKSDESYDAGEELADILWVVLCLSNQTGTDLQDAFQKSIEKKTARDAERHRQNPKLNGNP